MRALVALIALAGVAHADAPKDDDEGVPRLSLATESDRAGWQKPGFRLGLALSYGRMRGLRGAPSGRLLGPIVRAGLRLDDSWSIYASFQYASASARGGLSGLRFGGTVDPTWHVTPSLALAIGFGFGGIVEGRTGRTDTAMKAGDTSITLTSASPPLPACNGVGATALARATWSYVLGPRSTMNVDLETFGQYTRCVENTGAVEADTAQAIVREQYWPHAGVTLSWGVAWR